MLPESGRGPMWLGDRRVSREELERTARRRIREAEASGDPRVAAWRARRARARAADRLLATSARGRFVRRVGCVVARAPRRARRARRMARTERAGPDDGPAPRRRVADDSGSTRGVWGDALGDPVADDPELLRAHQDGLTETEMRDAFGRHKSNGVTQAKSVLLRRGLARMSLEATWERSPKRWKAIRLARLAAGPTTRRSQILA